MSGTKSTLMLWGIANADGLLYEPLHGTRNEAIRYECWNLGEVTVPDNYDGLRPWSRATSDEVSKTWRRLKRQYGLRVVRVLATIHPLDRVKEATS